MPTRNNDIELLVYSVISPGGRILRLVAKTKSRKSVGSMLSSGLCKKKATGLPSGERSEENLLRRTFSCPNQS
ncbi:MAG: hypothetical protein QOD84_148 [Acidobacteriaceae bacterium]|jgi:hypothetical protein